GPRARRRRLLTRPSLTKASSGMIFTPFDVYTIGRLLVGHTLNGEVAAVSGRARRLVEHLHDLPPDARSGAFAAPLTTCPDHEAPVQALADVDPLGPAPEAAAGRSAHLGDLEAHQDAGRFIWRDHLVRAHLNLLSSDPKVGKTYLTLELARRIY